MHSINPFSISGNLFKLAKADYMEVLMTQRDAVESKFDLIEIKQEQLFNMVSVYQAFFWGGGLIPRPLILPTESPRRSNFIT